MSHISNRGPDHWMFTSLWKWQAIGRLATRANYASLIRSGIGIKEIQGVLRRLVVYAQCENQCLDANGTACRLAGPLGSLTTVRTCRYSFSST